MRRGTLLFSVSIVVALSAAGVRGLGDDAAPPICPETERDVDPAALRDLILGRNEKGMREHGWRLWESVIAPCANGKPLWMSWQSAEVVLRQKPEYSTLDLEKSARQSPEISFTKSREFEDAKEVFPLLQPPKSREDPFDYGRQKPLADVLFNETSRQFILDRRLDRLGDLLKLSKSMDDNQTPVEDRHIPLFPKGSIVLKTMWVIMPKDSIVWLPVWIPPYDERSLRNPPSVWRDAVPVATSQRALAEAKQTNAKAVFIDQFFSIRLQDSRLYEKAQRLLEENREEGEGGKSPEVNRDDFAVLVGMHVMAKDLHDWVWATFWWHNDPEEKTFGADRPKGINDLWDNYLMDVAFDADIPNEESKATPRMRGPNICFNPRMEGWLQMGDVSNCISCHQSATVSNQPGGALSPSKVFRGRLPIDDRSTFTDKLRLDYLWSLAVE